jgi:REP element-mobilizing transposase RayT
MSRPLRIEFAGALYHVTSRGDRREPIYEDDQDRKSFLAILSDVMAQMHWLCHAYCLMTNHYHLLIETPDANLAKGMRQLNGIFTQASNRRHRRGGHLFQGRYKAIMVDKDSYLLELARYIVLNPVRAGMVALPSDWPWSSFRAMAGLESAPAWLETEGVLALFGEDRSSTQQRFGEFVMAGRNAASPWEKLKGQIYLGDDKFVKRVQGSARQGKEDIHIPKSQRRAPPPTLDTIVSGHADRNQAIVAAHATGAYSYQQIGDFFGVHFTTVGKIVRKARKGEMGEKRQQKSKI